MNELTFTVKVVDIKGDTLGYSPFITFSDGTTMMILDGDSNTVVSFSDKKTALNYGNAYATIKSDSKWIEFKDGKPKTHPTKYGKYEVIRKNNHRHLEVWNNTGWAYNHNDILGWVDNKNNS